MPQSRTPLAPRTPALSYRCLYFRERQGGKGNRDCRVYSGQWMGTPSRPQKTIRFDFQNIFEQE